LPNRIDAFFTRDVISSRPTIPVQLAQGGFLVARSNLQHFELYKRAILEANFVQGCHSQAGWGGLGYAACMQGGMHYQGIIAYFYDVLHNKGGNNSHAVELDVCRWNQVTCDVMYRGKYPDYGGKCLQYPPNGDWKTNTPELGACHDCRRLPLSETMSVHFTACSKPWQCRLPVAKRSEELDDTFRTNTTTCALQFREFFLYRQDVQDRIEALAGRRLSARTGTFHPETFLGFCDPSVYKPMLGMPPDFDMKRVYGF
jgi:hypothetical protein